MRGFSNRGKPPDGAEAAVPLGRITRLVNLRTFESLKVRDYRFYISSSLAQMAGMNMQWMVSGWFIYKLTGAPSMLGITMLVGAIPQLTLGLFGGTVVDRVPKKLLLMLGLLASSLVALLIAVPAQLGIITWHYLVASSFLQGVIMSFMMPARQSIISEIVGRDKLTNAVALNTSGMNINQIAAPALAGFMVPAVGIYGVYYLIATLQLLAVILLLPMRQAQSLASGRPAKRGMMGDIKDGLSYVRQSPTLLIVLTLSLLTVMLSMPFRMLLPLFTEDVLKVGPERLGVLMSVSGVGALAGSLVIASLGNRGRGMLFLHTGLITGVSIIAFSMSSHYWLSLVIIAFSGLSQAGRMTLGSTLVQSYTADIYLGRVMSLFMMQMGLTSLGGFGVSVAAEFVGVQWAVGATGVLLALTTLYFYIFSPSLRKLD